MKLPGTVRWPLVPIAAISGCAASTATTGVLGDLLVHALGSHRFESLVPFDVRVGLAYAAAAAGFVVLGTLMAPRRRLLVAGALYLFGALVAWSVLGSWYFPEGHPRAYRPSRVPLGLTLSGGLFGVLAIAAWQVRRAGGRT